MKPTKDDIKLDKKYLEWLSYQPSCLDGSFNQYENGVGRNIACHVRRQSCGAGMGKKPLFSAVPMTDYQHRVQSLEGEVACLDQFLPYTQEWNDEEAAFWFECQSVSYLSGWRATL